MLLANLSAPKVLVGESLRAGRFQIPLSAIGDIEVLDRERFGRLIGPEANPAAQLMIRGDVKQGARLFISDPSDPTPYVIISSRRPEQLIAAIDANRP